MSESLNLLWGAEAIALAIGRTTRATFGMLESGALPAKKVSGKWVARRDKLTEFFSGACCQHVASSSGNMKEMAGNGGELGVLEHRAQRENKWPKSLKRRLIAK